MENDFAIRVQQLGKCYRIGRNAEVHDSFAAQMASWLKSPVENYRALRALTHFGDKEGGSTGTPDDIFWALRHVSFDMIKGDVLGIIGRNGSGKSTLLKVLSRITELSEGRVEIHGRVASLLEVGTGFHQELSGRDNVYLNGTILGMTKREIDRKFDEIVDFSGVEKFIDTPVKRYSSGMRLRLAFSVAAHLRAEIMLIDEVLAVGDSAFQKKCIDKMGALARRGGTIILVSHNMAVVTRLCNKGIVLNNGEISYMGLASTAVSEYERLSQETSTPLESNQNHGVIIHSLRQENAGKQVKPGTAMTFLVDVEVRQKYFSLSLVFGFRTVDGQGLILDVVDSDQFPAVLDPGLHSMRISLPSLWLRPRTYTARVKVVAHPKDGNTERFFAEPLDVVIDGAAVTGVSDWVLQPQINWSIASSNH